VSLLWRESLEINVDLKLNVMADRMDAIRRLIFAQKIFFASLEKPEQKIE
jgi:hypothetical protein